MADVVSISIALVALLFSIAWTIWFYRKQQRPKINLYIQPAVITNFEGGIFFTTTVNGVDKSEEIPRGEFIQRMVSVKAHNVGTIPVTLSQFRVHSKSCNIPIKLQNHWLLVGKEDSEKMPQVLMPGQFWEGFVDWIAITVELSDIEEKRNSWDLIFVCEDLNGHLHKEECHLSDKMFNAIIEKSRIAALKKNPNRHVL